MCSLIRAQMLLASSSSFLKWSLRSLLVVVGCRILCSIAALTAALLDSAAMVVCVARLQNLDTLGIQEKKNVTRTRDYV